MSRKLRLCPFGDALQYCLEVHSFCLFCCGKLSRSDLEPSRKHILRIVFLFQRLQFRIAFAKQSYAPVLCSTVRDLLVIYSQKTQ